MSEFHASAIVFERPVSSFKGESAGGTAWFSDRRLQVEVGVSTRGGMFTVRVVDKKYANGGAPAEARDEVRASQHFYEKETRVIGRTAAESEYYAHIADVMRWLANLDLRGESSEDAVWTVFYALVIRQPIREMKSSILRDWAPTWFAMFEENHRQWIAKFDAP